AKRTTTVFIDAAAAADANAEICGNQTNWALLLPYFFFQKKKNQFDVIQIDEAQLRWTQYLRRKFGSELRLYKQKLVCCLRDSPRIHLRLLIYA
ncbi:unnamed protein product, partial [Brassica rapa subsp. trilocularis]